MSPISRVTFAILLGGVCAGLPVGQAWARVGEADVREGPNGGPCFGIAPREERFGTPDFGAIVVTDGVHPVWKMALPKERTFALAAGTCVPYGGRSAALPRTAAAPLVPGRIYLLRIDARPPGHGHAAASYEARFCLVRRADGGTAVRQLHSGEHDAAAAHAGSPAKAGTPSCVKSARND
jgi:hypothetical protein